jgi:hypothetical protein
MIKIAAEINTNAQQRLVGIDEMIEARAGSAGATLTGAGGGLTGVPVTVTSGCVLLIRAGLAG